MNRVSGTPADVIDLAPDGDGEKLATLVTSARARAGWARALETLTVAIPVVAAAAALADWAGLSSGRILAGAGSALTASAIAAWARRPTRAGVATLIDTRLQLADRVATGLRMRTRTDAVAQLIVRDAAGRLDAAGIATAIPFRAHARAGLAGLLALACAALWLASDTAPAQPSLLTPAGGLLVPSTARTGAGSSADRRTAPTDTTGTPGQAPAAANGQEPVAQLARGAIPQARPQEGGRGSTQPAAPESTAPGRSTDGRSDHAADETGRGGARGNPARDRTARGNTARGSPDSRQAADTGGRGAAAGRSLSGTTRGSGPADSLADTAATAGTARAGGIQGATARVTTEAAPESARNTATAASLRQARLDAEAAIAHDDVPPSRRDYVRNYFHALQPANRP